ncbi:Protein BYPASS-related [Arabidopsis thaliana x Arabidopsis arenosa]|uniref:Protein BYPASS-related n=1 Tax=Arabidopsis thaliana x Arabidopsis arenosa TaxID=1240361 RepID=A0A8T1Y3W3_9BRAS|nr:Protein BYPASS-related [Arabidopsis thaliana x Arabidopsis arenosa]
MARPTEFQGSFLSRISIRRNQIVSMDVNHEHELEELEYFQKHVAERFSELITSPSPHHSSSSLSDAAAVSHPSDPILSIPWLQNLLDVFMSCEAEFKAVLSTTQISKSQSLERVLPEMLDRILKALDLCNAVVNGIDSVRQSRRLAEIAVTALKQRPLCDGSVRRAKRALTSLLIGLNADERRDRNSGGSGSSNQRRTTSRSWSFGTRSNVTGGGSYGQVVSKNWSATKQIQAMVANLVLPRGAEASGPVMPVYIMSSVMVLVMWVLVAAVPCQTSSILVAPLPLPKHQSWASAAVNIQERIGEEMKRKEKRCGGGGGLMEEMQRMEKIGLSLMEFAERFRYPADEEEEAEVAEKVDEMEEICRGLEVGLEDLQRQVRQVFHRLVRSRIEIVSVLDQAPAI